MPYKRVGKCVHKLNSDGSVGAQVPGGCHETEAQADAHVRALYANVEMSTVLWIDPFKYTEGQPFRVFPIGKFKRGDRTLDITEQRLREMEKNYNAKNPRWEIPIYFGHPIDNQPDPPKGGNIKRLEFKPGDGLYAHPEYTDAAKKSVENGEYQYVSPGVLWSLGGSTYADENGNEFDNVIDHVALTNRPFFGHKTAIFSSDEGLMKEADKQMDSFSQFKEWFAELFKDYDTETRRKMAKSGAAMDDGSYPIADADDLSDAIHAIGRGKGSHAAIKAYIIKRARALGKTSMLPEDWEVNASVDAKGTSMDPITPEVFDAKVKELTDDFAAKFKAQNDVLEAEKRRSDEFATKLADERKTRKLTELKHTAEAFVALPVNADEFAEKFYALSEVNADLAKWFAERFAQFDILLSKADLFGQFSRENAEKSGEETIETLTDKIIADKFKGDRSKYADAFVEAGKQRPDLAQKHLNRGG